VFTGGCKWDFYVNFIYLININRRGLILMNKNILMIISALFLALFLCGAASAAEWNVTPGDSIQTTIDGANDNDTINVHDDNGTPYTYNENVLVNKTNLTLKAVGSVTLNNTNWDQPCIEIDSLGSYSTIEGFNIGGVSTTHNILLDGATNCNIVRNSFQGTAISGIQITNGYSNNVFENYLENAEIRLDSSNNNNISKNTGNSGSILVYGSYYNIIEENNLNNSYISLGWAYFNTISKNNLTNISGANAGIGLWRSQTNQIHDNILTGADNCENSGIIFGSSPDNTLSNNKIENFKYNLGFGNADDEDELDGNYYENIDITNTINGKPIYFLRGNNSQVFDGIALGYLGLIGCYDLEIKNISISNNLEGLLLVNTHNTLIENCNFSNNKNGVYLLKSYNNTINNSIMGLNTYSSTRFIESNGNKLLNNNITNYMYGFFSSQSENNTISHNTFQSCGIWIDYANGSNEISNNQFNNGTITLYFCTTGNNISGNTIENNGDYQGINIYYSPGNVLRNNNITNTNITNLNGNHNFEVSSFDNSGYTQDIDTSNLINGKPIYYLVGQNNLSIDGNIMGYLALISCDNINLRNIELSQMNGEGILTVDTNNTVIENSSIKNNGYAMIIRDCNNISINSSAIIDNSEGILVYGDSTLNIHFCRMELKSEVFANYNINIEDSASVEAENNWWGSNDDLRIYQNRGYIDYDPWLVMTFVSDPTLIPIFGTSNLTVNFTKNSDDQDTSSQGHIPDGLDVTFASDSLGSINPLTGKTLNGITTTTYTAGTIAGPSTVNAIADRQTKLTTIKIADLNVMSVNPVNETVNVPVNQSITITFSEPITAGTTYNNIRLKYPDGSGKPINLSISGNTLTITPKTSLAPDTRFTIYIPVNAVQTSEGISLTKTYTSVFTTAMTVTSINPVNGTVNVPLNKVINITFNEPITAGSTFSNIRLKYPDGSGKPINLSISGNTLTITPKTNLALGTTFTIHIPVNAIVNSAGATLASVFTSKFTTVSSVLSVTNVTPTSGAINVPVNQVITINFSEPITAGSAYNNIKLKYPDGSGKPINLSISGNTLTITPKTSLALGTIFTIYIPVNAIVTSTGATIASVFTSKFTTVSSVLSVTNLTPTSGAINVPVNQVITINFSEPITAGSAYNNIKLKYPDGSGKPINLSISGNTLTITPKTNLALGTTFTIYIPINAIVTSAGATLTSAYTSKFNTTSSNNPPSSTVKLTFIHHSCGSNWLANEEDNSFGGNLGTTLNSNNYYVTDTNYGWNAEPGDNLGDHTNTDDWDLWFNNTKMPYVYTNTAQTVYTNTISNPGGENEIIMFKSCFPLSEVGDSIDDEKAIYNNLKTYFAAHPDKMFMLITPPGETTVSSYQLTRDLCNWLVDSENGWLSDYTGSNVFVFDFYCVLSEVNSHHRWNNGQIEHVYASDYDGISPYHDGDDHPNAEGNQKATEEFIGFLNYAYNTWKS
jgi:parallel beta-helix repeat protein